MVCKLAPCMEGQERPKRGLGAKAAGLISKGTDTGRQLRALERQMATRPTRP